MSKQENYERIAKMISNNGFCSRRDAEKFISNGVVKVNGIKIDSPVHFVNQSDLIEINGKTLKTQQTKIWTYYKPTHVITSHKDPSRKTVFEIIKKQINQFLISAGRLDYMSEGLLVITNNPKVSHFLEQPKNKIKRKYIVITIKKPWLEKELINLKNGIEIYGIKYNEIKAKIINFEMVNQKIQINPIYQQIFDKYIQNSNQEIVEMTLIEGKNKEIRNIFEYFKLPVIRLIRISYGGFEINDISPNKIIEINKDFVQNFITELTDQTKFL